MNIVRFETRKGRQCPLLPEEREWVDEQVARAETRHRRLWACIYATMAISIMVVAYYVGAWLLYGVGSVTLGMTLMAFIKRSFSMSLEKRDFVTAQFENMAIVTRQHTHPAPPEPPRAA